MSPLEKHLNTFLVQIQKYPPEDEWYLSKFVDTYVSKLPPHQAYESIDDVSKIYQNYANEDIVYEVLTVLKALLITANTSSVPQSLINILPELKQTLSNDKFHYLHDLIQSILGSFPSYVSYTQAQ